MGSFLQKIMTRSALRIILPAAGLALAVLALPAPPQGAPATRTITLDARQFEYAPSRIEVNQGDHVIITLHADDVVHGFSLDGYGIQQRVTPGAAPRVEFVVDRAGTFRYRCSVTCGPMHPFMMGELVVGPEPTLWRASALTLIVAAGVLLWLRQASSLEQERIVS